MNKLELKLQALDSLNHKLNGQRLGNCIGICLVSLMLIAMLFRTRVCFFWKNEPTAATDPLYPRLNVFKR